MSSSAPDDDALRRQFYGARDIRSLYRRVTDNHLRYLEKWGLVRPAAHTTTERFYSFTDLSTIKQLAAELDRDVPLKKVLRSLLAEHQGQLQLDFHASVNIPAKVVSLPRRHSRKPPDRAGNPIAAGNAFPFPDPPAALAAKYFIEGSRLDDGDERKMGAAAAAYRRAAGRGPGRVPA